MDDLNVRIELVNQKVQFKVVSDLNPDTPVLMDFIPPIGDGEGFAGLELLLMSLTGCFSTAVVGLLRRMGKKELRYSVQAIGIREENPLTLKKVILKVSVQSDAVEPAELERAINAAAAISPVLLAVKNNVEVVTEFELNKK